MERIDKILSNMGCGTRKEVKRLVRTGAVKLNGEVIKSSDIKIDEAADELSVFDKPVHYKRYVYLMLNKPSGYVSAVSDSRYPTVTELVPNEFAGYDVFPIGRLDIDTEGLLLLSNDGQLAHRLLSPKKHVPKTYFVKPELAVTDEAALQFRNGMDLGDFVTQPADIKEADGGYYITIFEGKFHQIKRMFEKTDNRVLYLKRISMGSILLDDSLASGELRELSQKELALLPISL